MLVAVEESFIGKSYDYRLEECLPPEEINKPCIQLFGHFVEQESTTMTREKQTSHSVFSEIELVFQMEEKHAGVIQQPGKTQQRQGSQKYKLLFGERGNCLF